MLRPNSKFPDHVFLRYFPYHKLSRRNARPIKNHHYYVDEG